MVHYPSVMEIKIKECSRRVPTLKNEHVDSKNWWQKLYKIMDEDAAIPKHRRFEVLREIFPEAILQRILSMMSLIGVEDDFFKRPKSKSISYSSCGSEILNILAFGAPTRKPSDKINPTIPRVAAGEKEREVLKGSNPYLGFFRRPTNKAAIWRSVPKPPLKDMNLAEKANAVTEIIAQDFVQWLRKIENLESTKSGQEEKLDAASVSKIFEDVFGLEVPQLTSEMNQCEPRDVVERGAETKEKDEKQEKKNVLGVTDIMELFEIDVEHEASKSLIISIRELPSVSRPIAESRKLSHKSCRETLHRLLQSDLDQTRTKKKLTAFNSTLPLGLRWRPPPKKPIKPWYEPGYLNEDIQSMGTTWNGITNLWSTRGYSEWLAQNSELKPPKCLKDAHMLDPDTVSNEVSKKETTFESVHMLVGAAGEMQKKIGFGGDIEAVEDDDISLGSFQLHVL